MKQTIAILVGLVVATSAFAQGRVTFGNTPAKAVLDDTTGAAVAPGIAIAGLYYSTDLTAVPNTDYQSQPDSFTLAGTTEIARVAAFAGVYSAGTIEIANVPEATQVLLQVRAWSVGFNSYADAAAGPGSTLIGASILMGPVTLGGPVTGIPVPSVSALVQGFTITPVPEPSTIVLGLLGGLGAMVLLRRRK